MSHFFARQNENSASPFIKLGARRTSSTGKSMLLIALKANHSYASTPTHAAHKLTFHSAQKESMCRFAKRYHKQNIRGTKEGSALYQSGKSRQGISDTL